MTIIQYENKYIELSKYITRVIEDGIDRCKKVKMGCGGRLKLLSQLVSSGQNSPN